MLRISVKTVVFNRDVICISLGVPQAICTLFTSPEKRLSVVMLFLIINFNVTTSLFLNLCAVRGFQVTAKDFEKNYRGTPNFAVFEREKSEIQSEDHFYLERTDYGKKIDKSVNLGEDFFFWRSPGFEKKN